GAGAWGTALALVLHRKVPEVVIWAYEREVAQAINREHANALYLPGVALAPAIRAESELAPVAEADLVLLATPAQHLRACVTALATRDHALGARLVGVLGSPQFRPYLSDDPTGAEIGGAVKNVIAIACGIVVG